MVAQLCDSARRFEQAGGIASALPKGATSGSVILPGTNDNMSLFVYGNVEIKDIVTTKFGAGVLYEVSTGGILLVLSQNKASVCRNCIA